jgi:hypothetical protein
MNRSALPVRYEASTAKQISFVIQVPLVKPRHSIEN